MAWLSAAKSEEIVDTLVSYINANKGANTGSKFIDPYQQASSNSRTVFAFGSNFTMAGTFPKIQITVGNATNEILGGQNKTQQLKGKAITLFVYYYCKNAQKYTDRNGTSRINEAQVMTYLEEMQETFEDNNTFANFSFHQMKFGEIPTPDFNKVVGTFYSFFPMNVMVYRR